MQRPSTWPFALVIAIFSVVLPVVATFALLGTLATGKLGEGPLGWVSVVAWWATLATPLAAAVWAVKAPATSSTPTQPKVVGLVVAAIIAAPLLLLGAVTSIETSYNVSQGWSEPDLGPSYVIPYMAQFLGPLLGLVILSMSWLS